MVNFVVHLIQIVPKAKKEVILIGNYVEINVSDMLCKKNEGVDVVIVTAGKGNLSAKDFTKFNAQYPKLSVKNTTDFYDRFLVRSSGSLSYRSIN